MPVRSRISAVPAAALLLLAAAPGAARAQMAQEKVDLAVVQRIRDEGLNRSQIPELGGHLTDVIGPRLTGSTAMRRANEWTAGKFREWGLTNVAVEPWGEFGRGWELESYSGTILTPHPKPLQAYPVAWTAGTNGPVRGQALVVDATDAAGLARFRGRLRNAFVLLAEPTSFEPEFNPVPRRTPLADLLEAPPQQPPAAPTPEQQRQAEEARARFQAQQALRDTLLRMMRDEGAAALLTPSGRAYGILRVGGSSGRNPRNPIPPLELLVAHEQYGMIWRNAKRGTPVELEVNVRARFLEQDLTAANTLADLPGTDKASEYVMLGAHLDSWHGGTGATDNAAGSIVMMEAIRILKTLGVRPRRTIRIALWSGEEQGLLGSRAWVEKHRDLHPRISAYVNVDNGTGKIRGIWSQGNDAVVPVFEQLLWPFRDLGVVAVRRGNTGGTDHLAFDRVGVPGFNFIQDPIEYSIRTHHTDVDTWERLVIDDLKQAAVVVAATVYHLAMRDERVPRKPAPPATGGN